MGWVRAEKQSDWGLCNWGACPADIGVQLSMDDGWCAQVKDASGRGRNEAVRCWFGRLRRTRPPSRKCLWSFDAGWALCQDLYILSKRCNSHKNPLRPVILIRPLHKWGRWVWSPRRTCLSLHVSRLGLELRPLDQPQGPALTYYSFCSAWFESCPWKRQIFAGGSVGR